MLLWLSDEGRVGFSWWLVLCSVLVDMMCVWIWMWIDSLWGVSARYGFASEVALLYVPLRFDLDWLRKNKARIRSSVNKPSRVQGRPRLQTSAKEWITKTGTTNQVKGGLQEGLKCFIQGRELIVAWGKNANEMNKNSAQMNKNAPEMNKMPTKWIKCPRNELKCP